MHLDAEPFGSTPITIEAAPAALRLLVPPSAPSELFADPFGEADRRATAETANPRPACPVGRQHGTDIVVAQDISGIGATQQLKLRFAQGRAINAAAPGADEQLVAHDGHAHLRLVRQGAGFPQRCRIRRGPLACRGVDDQHTPGHGAQPQAAAIIGSQGGDHRQIAICLTHVDVLGGMRFRIDPHQTVPRADPHVSIGRLVNGERVVSIGLSAGQSRQIVPGEIRAFRIPAIQPAADGADPQRATAPPVKPECPVV